MAMQKLPWQLVRRWKTVPEKEMIFIVAKKEQKNQIMQAIMEKAGLDSKAKSIVFSLPVTDTAGLRLIED